MESNANPNDYLFAEERRNQIVQRLKTKRKVTVPELVAHFGVSPATIRNDLRDLEKLKLIQRTHGGAIPLDSYKMGYEPDHEHRSIDNHKQKRAIARRAIDYIEEGDIILLDTGTTTCELAKLLGKFDNLTVIVNDIEIARVLEDIDNVQVIVIGGMLRKKIHSLVGPFATKLLAELNVDKVILATNCFSLAKGCTTPDIQQAEVKKAMIDIAGEVILLCDSSKMERNSFVQFADVSKITTLITDRGLEHDLAEAYGAVGVQVVIAE